MNDEWRRVAVSGDGIPLPIDPRLFAMTASPQPTLAYRAPNNGWDASYALSSGYALPPEDLSLPYQASTSSSDWMQMSVNTSLSSYAPTAGNVSLLYQTSTSSFDSMPVPVPASSSSHGFPSIYAPPASHSLPSSYDVPASNGPPASYAPPPQDAPLMYHQPMPSNAPWQGPFEGERDIFGLSFTYQGLGGPAHGPTIAPTGPSYAISPSNAPGSGQLVPGHASIGARPPPAPRYHPVQPASNVDSPRSQDGQWVRDRTLVVNGAPVYTEACGIVTPSRLAPGQAPTQSGLNRASNPFHCPICDSKFDRRHSVKTHFSSCVRKNGNPQGKFWLDHPSLSSYKGPRREKSMYYFDRKGYYAMKEGSLPEGKPYTYRQLAPAPYKTTVPLPSLTTSTPSSFNRYAKFRTNIHS